MLFAESKVLSYTSKVDRAFQSITTDAFNVTIAGYRSVKMARKCWRMIYRCSRRCQTDTGILFTYPCRPWRHMRHRLNVDNGYFRQALCLVFVSTGCLMTNHSDSILHIPIIAVPPPICNSGDLRSDLLPVGFYKSHAWEQIRKH